MTLQKVPEFIKNRWKVNKITPNANKIDARDERTEVLIIGGGVVGTAIARSLSKYKLNVALVEKEADVGFGTSKANSGVIHADFHDQPGTFLSSA